MVKLGKSTPAAVTKISHLEEGKSQKIQKRGLLVLEENLSNNSQT